MVSARHRELLNVAKSSNAPVYIKYRTSTGSGNGPYNLYTHVTQAQFINNFVYNIPSTYR